MIVYTYLVTDFGNSADLLNLVWSLIVGGTRLARGSCLNVHLHNRLKFCSMASQRLWFNGWSETFAIQLSVLIDHLAS